jgi:hypothetical protein
MNSEPNDGEAWQNDYYIYDFHVSAAAALHDGDIVFMLPQINLSFVLQSGSLSMLI